MDIPGIYLGRGPESHILSAPYAGIGFLEAHGLAFIIGALLWRAGTERLWHITGLSAQALLGICNLLFRKIFAAPGSMAAGYVFTSLHWLFVILQFACALKFYRRRKARQLSEVRCAGSALRRIPRRRRTIAARFALALLLGASATAAAEVKSDYDRSFDLSKLRSFRFADPGRRSPRDGLATDDLAAKRLRSAIQSNLVALGIPEQTAAADFEVSYFATLRNQAQVTTAGRPRWGMGSVWVNQYVEGTAIVEFRDAKSAELVWRGFVTGTVDPEKSEEKINKGIKKLIEQFAKDRAKQKRVGVKA